MTRVLPNNRCISAALLVALLPTALAAQPKQISGQGTEGFRALIASYRLKPLRSLDDLQDAPERTLLIAFRGAEARGAYPLDLRRHTFVSDFVQRGGAFFYASDQPTRAQWLSGLGVHIDGNKLFGLAADCYQQRGYCPIVLPLSEAEPQLFRARSDRAPDALAEGRRGLERVATNRPSFLLNSTVLPSLARYEMPLRTEQSTRYMPLLYRFAQGKRFDHGGQLLVLADHSVFINDMLLPEDADNDNLAFAANCLDWLTFGPDLQKRDRILFIDQTGLIETDFNLALTELPPPPQNFPQLMEFLWANRDLLWEHRDKLADLEDSGFFRDLEQSNFFNDLLLSWQPHWVWLRLLLVMITMVLLFLGVRRLFGARFGYAKNTPRLAVALDRYRPRVGLLEQRVRSALSRGQALEAAREKARQLFADFALAPADYGQTTPEFIVDAGWWQRRRLRQAMREVWRIAYSEDATAVSTRQWPAFLRRLQNLRQAIRKGIIRVV